MTGKFNFNRKKANEIFNSKEVANSIKAKNKGVYLSGMENKVLKEFKGSTDQE